jgi:carbonic anhydrase
MRLSIYLLIAPLLCAQNAQEVLQKLRRGNQEFVAGRIDTSHLTVDRRTEVASAQHPMAAVLSCADSRVPPEQLFGQGLGDLFVVRVAGAVANPGTLGSLEYAVEHLGAKVVIVMGHTSCGAVKAVLDSKVTPKHIDAEQANLESLLQLIRPALDRPQERADPWTSLVYASVEQTLDDVMQHSPVLSEQAHKGKITIVGAVYQLDSGSVVFSKPLSVAAATAEAGEHSK